MNSPTKTEAVAVVIAGSGYLDGTEITEAISTLINLDAAGLAYQCYAPDREFHPVDHVTGEAQGEPRNLMVEAARICRGAIKPLAELSPAAHSALALPGGYGAAKSLSDFALAEQPEVMPQLATAIRGFHEAEKPILAMCIAPALLAITLGKLGVTLTIGSDHGTAAKLESFGCRHQNCEVTDIVVDDAHKLITTPAYMFDAGAGEVFSGVQKAVGQLAKWLS